MTNTMDKLEQLAQYIQATDDKSIPSKLDSALDWLCGYDYFGTEGQYDPRGDQRDAEFIPYDPDDDDSDGEYEYFKVETNENAVKCIKELISYTKKTIKNYPRYENQTYEQIEKSFKKLFDEVGLN